MLNFFQDEITLPGKSNLDDFTVRSCNITIGSNPASSNEDDGYFNVNFRMGIAQEKVQLTFLREIGISLNLEESEVFCEALYNLAKQNSETKGRVEIAFSGDNNAKALGAPIAYFRRSQADRGRVPLTITVEPVKSTKGVAKVTLQTPVNEKLFCSAVLSAQDALILAYMVRCGYVDAFREKLWLDDFRSRART
jgi:hypothetical protein